MLLSQRYGKNSRQARLAVAGPVGPKLKMVDICLETTPYGVRPLLQTRDVTNDYEYVHASENTPGTYCVAEKEQHVGMIQSTHEPGHRIGKQLTAISHCRGTSIRQVSTKHIPSTTLVTGRSNHSPISNIRDCDARCMNLFLP